MGLKSDISELPRANKIGLFFLTLVNAQDGFDLLAISFAANEISKDWSIDKADLGWVFGAALFGMLLGATFLSPFADKISRKSIAILGLFLSGVGMLLAMMSPNITWLLASRLLTGIGVGAIIPSLNTMAAEYAGPKLRSTMISIFQLGFPLGAILAGYICLWLLGIGTWRYVFAFGAGLSFIFMPVIWLLPESEAFLQKQADERKQANEQNLRGQALIKKPGLPTLFSQTYILRTSLISISFFLVLMVLYFLLSWMPKLIEDMGFTAAQGNRAGRLINLVGIIGIITIGGAALRANITKLTAVFMTGLAVMMLITASISPSITVVMSLVGTIGFFTHGAMIGLYSTVPSLFPVHLRATGTGWAIGISRLGAVAGPVLAGYLLKSGLSEQQLFYVFAPAVILAAITVYGLYRHMKGVGD